MDIWGYIHVLTTVNSAVLYTEVYISLGLLLLLLVFSGYIPRSRIAGLYGGSIFNFFPILFYVVTTQIYFPINSV